MHRLPRLPSTRLPGTRLPGTRLPGTRLPGTRFPGTRLTLGLLVSVLALFPILGVHGHDDDPLPAIVSMIASSPEDRSRVERAFLWARDQQRVDDLIDAIAQHGLQHRSLATVQAAIDIATEKGYVERAVEILEASLALDPSAGIRHQLASMWLAGGWPQQARQVASDQLPSDRFADIRSGLQLFEGRLPSATAAQISSTPLKLLADRSGQWKWGVAQLQQRGEVAAALEIAISGGLVAEARQLLTLGARPEEGRMSLQLARLLGQTHWQGEPLIDEGTEDGTRWRASMGIDTLWRSIPPRPDRLPPLSSALERLDAGDESAARRTVALWRLAGGGNSHQELSTRLILDQRKPTWLGADRLPESIERQLQQSFRPQDAHLAVSAALRAIEGTPLEARLWFQAGRLSDQPEQIQRSMRIRPRGEVAVQWSPGINARWNLPDEFTHLSEVCDPIALLPPTTLPTAGALMGSVAGLPVRRVGLPPSDRHYHLDHWQRHSPRADSIAGKIDERGVRLRITDGIWLRGDDRSLQVIDTSNPVERVLIRWVPREASSLLDQDGLPKAVILDQIFGSSARQECLRVATVPPPMELAMQTFGEDAGRRVRSTESMRWINFRPAGNQSWWVDVAGVSGLFTSEAAAIAPRSLPQETMPASSIETFPGPLPTSHLHHLGTRRHGIEPTAKHPSIDAIDAPQPLLPSGERWLLSAGHRQRVVLTDSGLVGYFESGASRASWWKELLTPPLPGVGGFAPLPPATVHPDLPWADGATPRLIEVHDGDGARRFLLLANRPTIIDGSLDPQPSETFADTHAFAGGTIDDDGQLWLIDAGSQRLLSRAGSEPLPRSGAYQLIATADKIVILGIERGQTWLMQFDGHTLHEFYPPPLPDERDRPHLRVASLARWGDEVLLLADRLWRISSDGKSHQALTPAPDDGVYRPVHWVQSAPRITHAPNASTLIEIDRPWGVTEIWCTR